MWRILLGISTACEYLDPTFRNSLSVPSSKVVEKRIRFSTTFEDGTDKEFRNVGSKYSHAVEIPRRILHIYTTRRKLKNQNYKPFRKHDVGVLIMLYNFVWDI